jgi:predicted transcriptional regulator
VARTITSEGEVLSKMTASCERGRFDFVFDFSDLAKTKLAIQKIVNIVTDNFFILLLV